MRACVLSSQARPSPYHPSKYSDDIHALSAFSAHMASVLGDSPGIHGLFASAYDEDQSIDSGNETETEAAPQSRQHRYRRSRRRSSLFADDASHSVASSSSKGPESSLTADQLHTASLGLHRSFTFASFQHFLIDSVYNSLSSSLLAGTPRSPSMSSSAHPQQTLSSSSSFMSVRKRTTSAPTIERSQSSSDLYTQADEQQEILEYKEAVSYWRRVLRSFAF